MTIQEKYLFILDPHQGREYQADPYRIQIAEDIGNLHDAMHDYPDNYSRDAKLTADEVNEYFFTDRLTMLNSIIELELDFGAREDPIEIGETMSNLIKKVSQLDDDYLTLALTLRHLFV